MNNNNQIQVKDHETSEAMAIDSSFSTFSTRKRALEVEASPNMDKLLGSTTTMEENINYNNNISSVPQESSNTVDHMDTLDIAWRDILHLLASLRNYEPGYLPLTSVQSHLNTAI